MQELALAASGALGMTAALVHGWLGDQQVARSMRAGPEGPFRVMRAVMALSALYWFVAGAALVLAPFLLRPESVRSLSLVAAAVFLSGALANLWALRGRHFGAPLLAVVSLFALFGGL